MNWAKAVRRAWGLPVVWAAEDEPQEPVTVVHVHYWVPVTALPQPRGAFGERRQIGAGGGQR